MREFTLFSFQEPTSLIPSTRRSCHCDGGDGDSGGDGDGGDGGGDVFIAGAKPKRHTVRALAQLRE